MKTRIRVISILAVLVFALAANPMMYAKGSELTYEEMVLSNTYPANVEVTREIELEQPALEAYYTMLNSFEAIYGDNNYPENYAGAYITDDNRLCILLVDISQEVCRIYKNYCANYVGVLFEKVEYSYEELENALSFATQDIAGAGLTSAYIDVVENNVKIGVDRVNSTAQGRMAGYSNYPIEIYYEQPATTEASTELYGGTPLSGYTLGGCGSYRGEDAVVLCGHGLSEGDTLRLQSNNAAFAEVVVQQFATDENYDYAVATINSGASVTLSNLVKNSVNYTTITSQSSRIPAVGSTVCMYGKTGGFGVGVVKAISSVLRDSTTGVVCYGLVKCEWNEGQEAYGAGSSGGPVYAGHVFYGTYTGSNAAGGNFWFSPIGVVTGFSIKTS